MINNKHGVTFLQEKAKEEEREKLGEKEETIPPDYRLEEVKVNAWDIFLYFILIHTELHIHKKGTWKQTCNIKILCLNISNTKQYQSTKVLLAYWM